MTESVQPKAESEDGDEEAPSLPVRAVKAYLSLGWFDRVGVGAMIILAISTLITLIGYVLGGLF